ncbi:unnamed protein product [Gordionus sp. m RMFG-2023]|uniref:importin-4-like n=1 Tax=Gordionus sp. m RMFG-2023 TaxID=3053472 RepID=UPI0030DEF7D7
MLNEFEQLISNFLIPDSEIIKESTIKLKEALKTPDCIEKLCTLINSSQNVMVRQYSAILLRNKIAKKYQWKELKQEQSQHIQEILYTSLREENEKSVLTMVCSAMAAIVKHKLEAGPWSEFFNSLIILMNDPSVERRERGSFILNEVLTPGNTIHFVARHLSQFTPLFTAILQDVSHPLPAFYVAKCLINLLPSLSVSESKLIDTWGQSILNLIASLVNQDEEKASELMEYFTDIIECDSIDNAHVLQKYVEIFLKMASNIEIPDSVRIKAVYFVRTMLCNKKKIIIKSKMTDKIVDIIMPLFCHQNPEDPDDESFYEEDSYQSSLLGSVTDLLEEMSINISPGKFMPNLLNHMEGMLNRTDQPYKQRGAFLALASVLDGCPGYIKQKCLEPTVKCVINGVKSDKPVVQKSAFHALSHMSDSLQPEIMEYHSQIMPLLYERIGQLSSNQVNSPVADVLANGEDLHADGDHENCLIKAFTAFETYIENMDKEILEPYLPVILRNMIEILKNPGLPIKLKEFAISCLSATASAAEELIQPYFPEILAILEQYLVTQSSDYEKLQIQSIDTLNMLSRCLKQRGNFAPFTNKCLEFSIKILPTKQDPDLKSVVYGLLGGLSALMKEGMAPFLPSLLPHFTESLTQTTEMMQVKAGKEDKNALTKIFDTIDEDGDDKKEADDMEDEEDECSDNESDNSCAVENAYIEEKENALLHLGEIASNLGKSFIPFLQPLYVTILPMLNHTYIDVQIETIKCLANFCSCLALSISKKANSIDAIGNKKNFAAVDNDQTALFAFNMMSYECLTKFLEIIRTDENKDVVCSAFEAINQIFKNGGSHMTQSTVLDPICTIVKRAINKKLKCQQESSDFIDDNDDMKADDIGDDNERQRGDHHDGEDDLDETEADELIIQAAYEVIPSMLTCIGAKKFGEGRQYLPYFLNDITKKMMLKPHQNIQNGAHDSSKFEGDDSFDSNTPNQRSFFLGILADISSSIPSDIDWEGKQMEIETIYRLIMDALTRSTYTSSATNDSNNKEVLSNAVFGMGCLVLNNPRILSDESKWPLIKFKIEDLIEKHISNMKTPMVSADDLMLRDNLIACLCRFIMASQPIRMSDFNEFVPVILKNLPLKKDFSENVTVYKCLHLLWTSTKQQLTPSFMEPLIQVVVNALLSDKVEDDAEIYLKDLFTQMYNSQAGPIFQSLIQNLNSNQKEILNHYLQ